MSRLKNLNVLIVDDEPEIRSLLIDMMESSFAELNAVANGLEALEYLQNHQVDLILSDVQMPEMGGLELIRTIQDKKLAMPAIILLSGQLDVTEKMAIDLGAKGLLHKPYKFKNLMEVISRLF